jgi:hypothetical protein
VLAESETLYSGYFPKRGSDDKIFLERWEWRRVTRQIIRSVSLATWTMVVRDITLLCELPIVWTGGSCFEGGGCAVEVTWPWMVDVYWLRG